MSSRHVSFGRLGSVTVCGSSEREAVILTTRPRRAEAFEAAVAAITAMQDNADEDVIHPCVLTKIFYAVLVFIQCFYQST